MIESAAYLKSLVEKYLSIFSTYIHIIYVKRTFFQATEKKSEIL